MTKAKETHKDEDRLNEVLDFLRQDFANRLGYIEEQAGIERKPGIQSPDARVKSEVMEVVLKSAGPGMDRPTLAERQSLAGRRQEPPPPPKPKVVKTIKVHPSRKGVPRRGVMQLVVPQQVASEMKNLREVAKRRYEEGKLAGSAPKATHMPYYLYLNFCRCRKRKKNGERSRHSRSTSGQAPREI